MGHILKRTQQLTGYDDAEFLNLEKDHAQQITFRAVAGNGGGGSILKEWAMRPETRAPYDLSNQPPPRSPPSGGPQGFRGGGSCGRMPRRPLRPPDLK